MKAFMLSCGKNCKRSLERVVRKCGLSHYYVAIFQFAKAQSNAPAFQRNILQQCCARAPVACRGIHHLAKYCKRVSKRTGHRWKSIPFEETSKHETEQWDYHKLILIFFYWVEVTVFKRDKNFLPVYPAWLWWFVSSDPSGFPLTTKNNTHMVTIDIYKLHRPYHNECAQPYARTQKARSQKASEHAHNSPLFFPARNARQN